MKELPEEEEEKSPKNPLKKPPEVVRGAAVALIVC